MEVGSKRKEVAWEELDAPGHRFFSKNLCDLERKKKMATPALEGPKMSPQEWSSLKLHTLEIWKRLGNFVLDVKKLW